MSIQFVLQNGLLVRKLFIGPLLPADYKPTISRVLEQYENVKEPSAIIANIKEQQVIIAATADNTTVPTDVIKPDRHKHKVIRRRRKFVYHAADEVIAKGYWKSEKRSLTRYHSNSLMFEYNVVK